MILFAKFLCGEVSIEVEEPSLGRRLAALFLLERHSSGLPPVLHIVIAGEDSFIVTEEGRLVSSGLRFCDLVLVLDRIFERVIRDAKIPGAVSLHASSALMSGKAISFVGRSGSGKTTFALEASRFGGGLLGDEYAWFDVDRCCLAHELSPVHVKDGGLFQLRSMESSAVRIIGCDGFRVNFVNSRSLGLAEGSEWQPLHAFVFPRFDAGCRKTELRPMDALSFAEKFIESAVLDTNASRMLKRLWRLIGSGKALAISITYSSVEDACVSLLSELGLPAT